MSVFSRFFKKGENGARVFFVVHGTRINLCCSNSPPSLCKDIGGGGGGGTGTCTSMGTKFSSSRPVGVGSYTTANRTS